VPKQTKSINTTTSTTTTTITTPVSPSVATPSVTSSSVAPSSVDFIPIPDIQPDKLPEESPVNWRSKSGTFDLKLRPIFENTPLVPIGCTSEKNDIKINEINKPKEIKRFEKEVILALRSKPICMKRPEGRLPSEIVKEYNQEYEKQEKDLSLSLSLSSSLSLSGEKFRNESFEKQSQNRNNNPVKINKTTWKVKSQGQVYPEQNLNDLRHSLPTGNGLNGTNNSKKKQQHQKEFLSNLSSSQNDDEEEGDSESDEDDLMQSLPTVINGNLQETNPRRLETRQRQIVIGMNTPGYQRYIQLVQHPKRGDPQIPNKLQVCSKRSWDGQIRKWRRMLHRYDPDPLRNSV